jgi:hypothetical protein
MCGLQTIHCVGYDSLIGKHSRQEELMNDREMMLRGLMQDARDRGEVRTVDPNDDRHASLMRAAFDCVANPDDWKGPIVAVVRDDTMLLGLYLESIRFMTATEPDIYVTGDTDDGHKLLTIVSEGYRCGPAGP